MKRINCKVPQVYLSSHCLGLTRGLNQLDIFFMMGCITCLIGLVLVTVTPLSAQEINRGKGKVTNIGSQRELFVDDLLIDKISGKAMLRLNNPIPQGVAMLHDEPWEGNASVYHSIFKDGDIFRMYYRAEQIDFEQSGIKDSTRIIISRPNRYCYAESVDGINWRKPILGLYEYKGSKQNNIILTSGDLGGFQLDFGDNASMFKDENPDAPADARYKAIIHSRNPNGLLSLKSADGIHWLAMSKTPGITEGPFDTQCLAFWDNVRKEYRIYWRYISEEVINGKKVKYRDIVTATSKDFLTWSNKTNVKYLNSTPMELYTSQVMPYYRAPHMFIGLPTRYIENLGWSESMRALPDLKNRELRASIPEHGAPKGRLGTALTDVMLMAGRDGVTFKRWDEAFLRPGIERVGTWNYGQHYLGWQMLETKSALNGAPNELSFYSTEGYWIGNSDALRRYTLRLDGFVSVQAPLVGGELVTKPVQFSGKQLFLNFSTSAGGSVRVEIQDMNGKPLPGFALKDCPPVFGDSVDRIVNWENGNDVSSIIGKAVRLRFEIKDGDLYSYQFRN